MYDDVNDGPPCEEHGDEWCKLPHAMTPAPRQDAPDAMRAALDRYTEIAVQLGTGGTGDDVALEAEGSALYEQLLRALAPHAPEPVTKFAWVIVDSRYVAPFLRYYNGVGSNELGPGWTLDHTKAIRFSRKEDAFGQVMSLPHGWHLIGNVEQHGWDGERAIPPQRAGVTEDGPFFEDTEDAARKWLTEDRLLTAPETSRVCRALLEYSNRLRMHALAASRVAPQGGET